MHDALERARPPLVEVHPARERFQPHLQIAILDADARQLEDQVVHQLVIQDVDFVALLCFVPQKLKLCFEELVDPRLLVNRMD